MFRETDLRGRCEVVSSYVPSNAPIKDEVTGEGETEKLHQFEIYQWRVSPGSGPALRQTVRCRFLPSAD